MSVYSFFLSEVFGQVCEKKFSKNNWCGVFMNKNSMKQAVLIKNLDTELVVFYSNKYVCLYMIEIKRQGILFNMH